MRIQLNFKSPLYIGGKKHSSNFMECEEVINGSVIKAAFAKEILKRCSEFNEEDPLKVQGVSRGNWVYFRDGKGCDSCEVKSLCKDFSSISFSSFYPKDTEVIPLTSMRCKDNGEHGFLDVLVDDISEGCKICKGKLDTVKGLRIRTGEVKKPYGVIKALATKNGINPYTKTALDGKLYTIETITATKVKDDEEELIYEGVIDNISKEDLKAFKTLRVGGDTTSGLGKCEIVFENQEEKPLSIEEVKEFSGSYRFKEEDTQYMAVKFTAHGKIPFKEESQYLSREELIKQWETALKLEGFVHIDRVYSEFISARGYDSSICNENRRTAAENLVGRGTVIVFKTKEKIEKLYEYFMKLSSFGEDGENGFGKFEIYVGR